MADRGLVDDGALIQGVFQSGSRLLAANATVHLLYDTDTGGLYYDADGSGSGAAVQVASLTGIPDISASNFVVL